MRSPLKNMKDVVEQPRCVTGTARCLVKQIDRRCLAAQLAISRRYSDPQFARLNPEPTGKTFAQCGPKRPGSAVVFKPLQLNLDHVGQNLVSQSQGSRNGVSLIVARTAINRLLVAWRKRPVILERVCACLPGSSALEANLVALVVRSARMVVDITIVRRADAPALRLQKGLPQGVSDADLW